MGPTGVSIDLLKCAGGKEWSELQKIEDTESILEDWRDSFTIPLYKGKRDALQCCKHRWLRLMEHGIKARVRILYRRVKKVAKVSDNHFGFMEGKSTRGSIFIVRQL